MLFLGTAAVAALPTDSQAATGPQTVPATAYPTPSRRPSPKRTSSPRLQYIR